MSVARLSLLLCVSLVTPALADEAFVTQLRMPARERAVDAFAWRGEDGVAVERAALERLGVAVPPDLEGPRIALTDILGLTYAEDGASSAIILNCAGACLPTQNIGGASASSLAQAPSVWGGFVNYDVATQWDEGDTLAGGFAEVNVFGPFGRGETTWLARTEEGVTRLDTSWTMDMPPRRVRMTIGDSYAPGVGGGVAHFAGVQIGRRFGLDPSFTTHPTPALIGEAETASTVELYIDGALRARESVQAGPFTVDSAPFVTGAGEAQLVVTDALGRQQVLSRPFFVSTDLLRRGLSDWSVALGVERERYGERSAVYGQTLGAVRYRRGITDALTAEAAFDAAEAGNAGEIAATMAHHNIGQLRLLHARSEDGALNAVSYFLDATRWSFGVQVEDRDPEFSTLGRDAGGPRQTAAASFNLNLGRFGTGGVTMASADLVDQADARTISMSYAPELSRGASLNFRLGYTEHERRDFNFGVSFSVPLRGDVTSSYAADVDREGMSYRAAAQHAAPAEGGFGWRARATGGVESRVDLSGAYRGGFGESGVRIAHAEGQTGFRAEHSGAVGWIDGEAFAGRDVRGAFALVDAGAPNVTVMRDRLRVGRTGRNGRVFVADLRPNETNFIAVALSELPMDRATTVSEMGVTPLEGTGVVIRFDRAVQRMREACVRYADGAVPPRGAVLVRARDGARFPVGSEGRVVLMGAVAGDRLSLEGRTQCQTDADDGELVLRCAS